MSQEKPPPPQQPDAEAFVSGTSLSLGLAPGDQRRLHQRIGAMLAEALPEALVLVASFDEQRAVLHQLAWVGAPEAIASMERGEAADEAPCPADVQARLLEARLQLIPRVDDDATWARFGALSDAWADPACYELGLAYDGTLLGAVTLLHPRPLSPAEERWLEALAQHAGIALARERVEAVDETALLVGLDGRVQACSRQTVERLGPTADDPAWSGAGTREPSPEVDLAARRAWAKALLGQGQAVRYTDRAGGRIRDCSLHPVVGDDGEIQAFAGFARDITEQVRLQERVRQAATFQRALFSSLSEGILVLDEQGVITDCNPAMLQVLGMANEQLVGQGGASLCAQRASWEQWERELLPQLEPGGEPVQFELRLRRSDGASFTARVGASRVALPSAQSSLVWTVRDVTDELLRFEQLEHLATHDVLTGLPNRLLFQDRLGRAREAGRRYSTSFAAIMMDLDGFKPVNDTLGHETGDQLLAALGVRLRDSLRAADTVSRLGGDEFAVLLPNSITEEQALQVGRKLLAVIEEPFEIDGRALRISASLGVAMFPQHDTPQLDLLAHADQAMYVAKRQGGHRVLMAAEGDEPS